MRAVIQRVKKASVTINQQVKSSIETGLLVLLGIEAEDTQADIEWLCKKIINMRIFNDEAGKMNYDIGTVNGRFLVVSQFTLHASTKKGNRPSYTKAAHPDIAIPLYNAFVAHLEQAYGQTVGTGEFGAYMQVELLNDGPVTIIIDSKQRA